MKQFPSLPSALFAQHIDVIHTEWYASPAAQAAGKLDLATFLAQSIGLSTALKIHDARNDTVHIVDATDTSSFVLNRAQEVRKMTRNTGTVALEDIEPLIKDAIYRHLLPAGRYLIEISW